MRLPAATGLRPACPIPIAGWFGPRVFLRGQR